MRVLVTGAAGYLGSGAVQLLASRGHTVRQLDLNDPKTEHEFVQCDLLNPDGIFPALEGIDVVFHTAFFEDSFQWQGNATRRGMKTPFDLSTPQGLVQTDSKSFAVNVLGTFNLLRVMQEVGVPKAVIVTSEAARGQQVPRPHVDVFTEETPATPDWVYALTKYSQEIVADYFSDFRGIKTICLRNGLFGHPEGFSLQRVGAFLINQRLVMRRDLVLGAVLAIENETLEHEVFFLENKTEFAPQELPELRANPEKVIERHFPGAIALMKEYDIDIEAIKKDWYLYMIDDISKAKRLLGWEPRFAFRDFYENLKAGKYPKDHMFVDDIFTEY